MINLQHNILFSSVHPPQLHTEIWTYSIDVIILIVSIIYMKHLLPLRLCGEGGKARLIVDFLVSYFHRIHSDG